MNDSRDRIIRRRFAALPAPDATPDWQDVVRRASGERRAASNVIGTSMRGWRILGGAAAVLGSLVVVGVLFVTTRSEPDSSRTIADGRPATIVAVSRERDEMGGTRIYRLTIDVRERRVELLIPEGLSSPEDPLATRTVLTPERTYSLLPVANRLRSGGRAWVSAPTDGAQLDELTDLARFVRPTAESVGGSPGSSRLVDEGIETIDGAALTRYRLEETNFGGLTPTTVVWLDEFVRLRRLSRGDDAYVTVVSYDQPVEITLPAEPDVFSVPTNAQAEALMKPSAGRAPAPPSGAPAPSPAGP